MIHFTPEMSSFLREHEEDDTTRLLLSASRYPGIDVRWAVEQLESRRQLRYKLPEWYALADRLIMGGRIPAEQCSSEQTARYKRHLVRGERLCDLTGGMGVDCYYMSEGLQQAIYTERQPHLCEAARHNFEVLGAHHIEVREGESFQLGIPDVDTLYLDPARRAQDGSRVYDLTDCEPDVVLWQNELMKHCKRLIVKVSPMVDITRAVAQMQGVSEVHVVAVRNECKEVLLVIDGDTEVENVSPMVYCVDFRTQDEVRFSYRLMEEIQASPSSLPLALNTGCYLYEPDVALLKAGAFRLLSMRYGVQQVEANSHLYVSTDLQRDFPGRIFSIQEVMDFSGKMIKKLKMSCPQANISTRNFPLSADELRKRSGIRDGGECYLFGTKVNGLGAKLLMCRKVLVLILLLLCVPGWVWARKKKTVEPETLVQILQHVRPEAPCLWNQGAPFLYLDSLLNPTLHPKVPQPAVDTLCYKNTVWTFDGILSEEDWMGRQCMQLQFRSPQGRMYRFATERLMSAANDTAYHPALPFLCPIAPIEQCNDLLRGRAFYLLINDERLHTDDTLRLDKFCLVTIDSVTVGTELAPLRVWINHPKGKASVLTSLPNSRENATSVPIQRYFSTTDPYLQYPNITAEVWSLICSSKVRVDMNQEEVRLSLGRPQRFEHYNSKGGALERWHYADRLLVEFVDGRVRRLAIER